MTGGKTIRSSLTALMLGVVATGAMAQSSPFDMSPEKPAQTAPAPVPPPTLPPLYRASRSQPSNRPSLQWASLLW